MVTKLTSVKTVISKVIADADLQEDDLRISDIREWIGEGIEKIGAVTQLERKVSGVDGAPIIKIKGHQAQLPCDLHQLHQVAYSFNCNGPWLPTRKATGSFAVWKSCCCDCDCECMTPEMIIQNDVLVNLVVDMFGNIDKTKAIEEINTNQNLRTILTNLINLHTVNVDGATPINPSYGIQYTIKPGYIMTNVPDGYLKLSYSTIPTDEEGYALVPDKVSYTEALYWYVMMKLYYADWRRGELKTEVYYDMRNNWNFYRNQAYAEALMPNEDGMEALKNNWNKLYPEFRDHNSFYSHTGERQTLYNATV